MIELTPLEETVAVKQLIDQGLQKGMEKGIEKGMEKGMAKGMAKGQFIGQIQLIQLLLKRPQTPTESLVVLDVEELRDMLAKLETELSGSANWR